VRCLDDRDPDEELAMSSLPEKAEAARRGGFTAEEIEARVRRYHKPGNKLLKPSTKTRSNQLEPNRAEGRGPSPASVRAYHNEYRRFANAYTAEELEELLKLRTAEQGTPLGWGIVRKLMTVENRTRREKLQSRAARESWSVRQAEGIIQGKALKKRRGIGGRPLTAPRNLTELLYRLELFTGGSQRRLALWTANDFLNQATSSIKVDDSLRTRVSAVREELKDIVKMARVLSRKLEKLVAAVEPQ
jgi:hypothetical protein